jgi:hypothetical protein
MMQFNAMWGDDCHVVSCLRRLFFGSRHLVIMAASLPRSVQGHIIAELFLKRRIKPDRLNILLNCIDAINNTKCISSKR